MCALTDDRETVKQLWIGGGIGRRMVWETVIARVEELINTSKQKIIVDAKYSNIDCRFDPCPIHIHLARHIVGLSF